MLPPQYTLSLPLFANGSTLDLFKKRALNQAYKDTYLFVKSAASTPIDHTGATQIKDVCNYSIWAQLHEFQAFEETAYFQSSVLISYTYW